MSFIPATLLWHQNHSPRQLLPANSCNYYCYGSSEDAERPLSEKWRRQWAQHPRTPLETCFLSLFHDMAFFHFNFSVTAATVSDGTGASDVKVDGAGSWLPSHYVLPRRLTVAAAQGLGARLLISSMPLLRGWCCWLSSMSFCSHARKRAMVSCSHCWLYLAAISKSSRINGSRCLSMLSCSPWKWKSSLVRHSWLWLLMKNLCTEMRTWPYHRLTSKCL